VAACRADEVFVSTAGVLRSHHNPHGGTGTLAWRVEADDRSVVWAPDAGYAAGAIPPGAVDFYRGADLLIHDATYTPEDWAERSDRGFSSIREAVDAAVLAGVRALALTHYDPDYSDERVDALAERARRLLDERGASHVVLHAAREGLTLDV
jgi:ribonuclease BN (tRNA processing enzyme)